MRKFFDVIPDDVNTHFELNSRDNRAEVCISASFAISVKCSLYLKNSCTHGCYSVGNSHIAVVVGMDTKLCIRKFFAHFMRNFVDFGVYAAAVCITEDNSVCTCFVCCFYRFFCILRVIFVAVEEVFSVEENSFSF